MCLQLAPIGVRAIRHINEVMYRIALYCILLYCPGGVLPYMGYIGMCSPKGYGFSAVLVTDRVSILAILPPFW